VLLYHVWREGSLVGWGPTKKGGGGEEGIFMVITPNSVFMTGGDRDFYIIRFLRKGSSLAKSKGGKLSGQDAGAGFGSVRKGRGGYQMHWHQMPAKRGMERHLHELTEGNNTFSHRTPA